MILSAQRLLRLGLGIATFAVAALVIMPVVEAQFWQQWFNERPRKPRPRVVKPIRPPPGDDLPPIVPRESTAPPPPDDRPYDAKLLRLGEILGAVHYLRELCGAEEEQLWREQMKAIIKNEATTATRRAKLVNSFNDGYRGYRRTYRNCTSSATLAASRFTSEGARIAASLAKTSEPAKMSEPARAAPEGEDASETDEETSPEAGAQASNQPSAEAAPQTGEAKPKPAQAETELTPAAATAEARPPQQRKAKPRETSDFGAPINR